MAMESHVWLDLRLFSRHWLRDAQLSKAVMSNSSCVQKLKFMLKTWEAAC